MFIGIEASHANKPDRTGVEEYCFQLIQELKKIIPPDVRVVLYTNKPLGGDLKNLPTHWEEKILTWPPKKGWSQVRLALELWRRPPTVFFAPAQLVPFITPKNTVAMLHDSSFIPFPKAYNFWGRQYLKVMNWLVVWWSKIIITSTNFNKREILKYYGLAYESKIRVVPLAFNSQRYRTVENLTHEQEVWLKATTGNKPFILSVGRLEEKKNTRSIVEAFSLFRERYPASEVQLVLVGKPGVGYADVAAAIERSKYKNSIIRPGYVWDDDLVLLYNRAKAFVFPSHYEGFGIPVLEAMASGCPVITATGSALEEVGGNAAKYVDPGSLEALAAAIEKILVNTRVSGQMTADGLLQAKRFSWRQTAEQTWKIFTSLF